MAERTDESGTTPLPLVRLQVWNEDAREVWESCMTALALLRDKSISDELRLELAEAALRAAASFVDLQVVADFTWPAIEVEDDD